MPPRSVSLLRSRPEPIKPSPPKKVWMLSYECAGLAHFGGLGEAVAGLAGTLARDYHLEITVLLPSHGKHTDQNVRESYSLKEERTFIARGYRRGVNGVDYPYLAGIEKGSKDSVRYVLVKGLDPPTSKWLDSRVLYDHETTFEKMALFARTLKAYVYYLLATGQRVELPHLIHAHDWHMVPAGVAMKQLLELRRLVTPLTFTVHLLGHVKLPWHYASEEWCGISDVRRFVRVGKKRLASLSYRQLWEDLSQGSLEKFGCYEADYVTSVSDSYLNYDVRNYVGGVIDGKSGHIYNGCDWDYTQIESTVLEQQKQFLPSQQQNDHVNRWDLRKYLLTEALAAARPITGLENDQSGIEGKKRQIVQTFSRDGPLVLMTGRLSPQKGVDILLDAVPLVLKALPETRFLLFLLPPDDSASLEGISVRAAKYPSNVRIILGRDKPIYLLSHLSADVYAMPSRSEPFGISALEAMVTRNPVVGADIGGIRETVLDIEKRGESGTGILVPSEDVQSLAASLASVLFMMMIDEFSQRGNGNVTNLIRKTPLRLIREMVSKNPFLGSRIRENCRIRVEENFRWENAAQMALERYSVAATLTKERTR